MTASRGGSANGVRQGVNPFLVAVVVGLAAFMEVLDISIANVSLRNIAGSLSAGEEESTWVLTSYLVANAIVLPMSGWFSMLLGRRRFYILSIILFTISSLLCGLAPSLPWLIAFRVLQGLGGGALQPVSQAILADAFPPERRPMAFAIYGMSVVAAPAIGPTLGGWITDNLSWHWVFLINVPVGIVLVALSRLLIRDPDGLVAARRRTLGSGFRVDYPGFALIALCLGALQIVLDKGQQEDWFESGLILWLSVMSATALVAALFWEWRHSHPVVNLRLMRDRNFATGMAMMFMLGFVLLGSTVLLPLMTQSLLGYSPTQAGMVISPGGVCIMVLMPIVGALVSRTDPRRLIAFGLAVVSASMFYMTAFDLSVDYHSLMVARVFQTFGMAFLFIPINAVAYMNSPPEESGNASALINLSRNIGGSVGISLLTTLLARGAQEHQAHMVDRFSPLDPNFGAAQQALAQQLGDPAAAQGLLYGLLQKQASLLSFMDDFRLLGVAGLAMIPLVLLFRKGRPGAVPEPVH
ncbi:MAG: DHA2 family efflux MFS transporter permease subunit [Gammaproteobacteria bacterium]|nr:DHA2 family efflux MFS transporter permease subunit [Gammaproteobacteria bacterium]